MYPHPISCTLPINVLQHTVPKNIELYLFFVICISPSERTMRDGIRLKAVADPRPTSFAYSCLFLPIFVYFVYFVLFQFPSSPYSILLLVFQGSMPPTCGGVNIRGRPPFSLHHEHSGWACWGVSKKQARVLRVCKSDAIVVRGKMRRNCVVGDDRPSLTHLASAL